MQYLYQDPVDFGDARHLCFRGGTFADAFRELVSCPTKDVTYSC